MKEITKKRDYSVGFIYAIILCSMLLVFPFRIDGMEASAVVLFLLCIVWMLTDIFQIRRGKRKPRSNYRRLDMTALILLAYEVGLIAVSMLQELGEDEPEPNYSWNLMIIGLILLYLLVMEAGTFRAEYLDLILYGAFPVMAFLLLGYLFDPQIGESMSLWENPAAISSYLIPVGVVSALQYCRCEERMRRLFYAMCAGISFFLLACNHSVISLWIMTCTLLTISTLIRPTAALCKNAMQMLFLFLLIISSMGLITNNTELLLTAVHYDAEHSVCLEMVTAAGAFLFFYCWYRKPEGVPPKRIVMRGFYKLDKLVLRGLSLIFILFLSGGTVWKTWDADRFGLRCVSGFAEPLAQEAGQNQSMLLLCMGEQGVAGAVLCIVILALLIERINRAFGWDKPMTGALCVIAVSFFPQLFLWEITPNILPIAVILTGSILSGWEKREGAVKKAVTKEDGRKKKRGVGTESAHGKNPRVKTGKDRMRK